MYRVSNVLRNNNFLNSIMKNESKLFDINRQATSGKKIDKAFKNPLIADSSIKFKKSITMIGEYKSNIDHAISYMDYADKTLSNFTSVLQRVRELAVQASNDTLNAVDRKNIATEINQHLEQLVNLANEKMNGNSLFAGFETLKTPFMANNLGDKIKNVMYMGDNGVKQIAVSDKDDLSYTLPGNKLFFSENTTIVPQGDFFNFIAPQDSKIKINDTEIQIYAGDTIEDLISRINKSDAGVQANIDLDTGEFYIETTEPHQPFLQDIEGNLLKDLNIINEIGKPPHNIANGAKVFGGSIFDQLINFRTMLEENNGQAIGTRVLNSLDNSLNNVLKHQADLGAKSQRLEMTYKYLDMKELSLTESISEIEDVDLTEAITKLKSYELIQNSSLQLGSRLNKMNLLNYLR